MEIAITVDMQASAKGKMQMGQRVVKKDSKCQKTLQVFSGYSIIVYERKLLINTV